MVGSVKAPPVDPRIARIQAGFEVALPRMKRVLRFRLRHLRGEKKEEAEAECLAICWAEYRRLSLAGRDADAFAAKIAQFAALTESAGRGLCGAGSVNDPMSRRSRHLRGHTVQSIADGADGEQAPEVLAALADRKTTDPAEEAVARMDFEAWLARHEGRLRDAAEGFAEGMTNQQVAERHGLGRGTGSAWRRELRRDYEDFEGGSDDRHR